MNKTTSYSSSAEDFMTDEDTPKDENSNNLKVKFKTTVPLDSNEDITPKRKRESSSGREEGWSKEKGPQGEGQGERAADRTPAHNDSIVIKAKSKLSLRKSKEKSMQVEELKLNSSLMDIFNKDPVLNMSRKSKDESRPKKTSSSGSREKSMSVKAQPKLSNYFFKK